MNFSFRGNSLAGILAICSIANSAFSKHFAVSLCSRTFSAVWSRRLALVVCCFCVRVRCSWRLLLRRARAADSAASAAYMGRRSRSTSWGKRKVNTLTSKKSSSDIGNVNGRWNCFVARECAMRWLTKTIICEHQSNNFRLIRGAPLVWVARTILLSSDPYGILNLTNHV